MFIVLIRIDQTHDHDIMMFEFRVILSMKKIMMSAFIQLRFCSFYLVHNQTLSLCFMFYILCIAHHMSCILHSALFCNLFFMFCMFNVLHYMFYIILGLHLGLEN